MLFYYSKLSKNQDKTINNAQCSNEMPQSFFKKEKRKKKFSLKKFTIDISLGV